MKKMKTQNMTDNSSYTDGFPDDDRQKKDDIKSQDPSRPFDSGRTQEKKKTDKSHNPSGTTMNEPNKYKK